MVRGYFAIGLHQPKNRINVGSVLRAAQCFGAAFVATSGRRYERAPTDTMNAYRHLPLLQVDDLHSVVPYDCVPIAVDLVEGAQPLATWKPPERCFDVFGPEDGTLGARTLSWCRDVVAIPAGCLNLAAATSIVLYDRVAKLERAEAERVGEEVRTLRVV